MKKQIALLAAVIAASGFTAYGQDWITFGTSSGLYVYDEFTTSGTGVYSSGNVDVAFLWDANTSLTGQNADLLTSDGSEFGLKGGAGASDQVATNGVTSVGSANPE